MKLNQKQKRVLISIPIVFVLAVGIITLVFWWLGGDQIEIWKAFQMGAVFGCLFPLLSLLFNWPMNLKN